MLLQLQCNSAGPATKAREKSTLIHCHSVQRSFLCLRTHNTEATARCWPERRVISLSWHVQRHRGKEFNKIESEFDDVIDIYTTDRSHTIVIHVRQTPTQYVMRVGTSEYVWSSMLPRLRLTGKGPGTLAFVEKVCSYLNLPVGHEESFKPKKHNCNVRGRVS